MHIEARALLSQLKTINRQFGQTEFRSPALTNEHADMTKPSLPSHRVEKYVCPELEHVFPDETV